MYKKNNGSTEQEILQNQFSAYVKKAVHNRRIQFLTEKSRKFRFETPLFDLDYLLFDTTDIIQEITDHETVRQALRSIKENERRIVLERIIEEKSFGQLSDELGMSYKTVASLYRSRQIISDFSHNTMDERAAATALSYGLYVDPSAYGMDGEPYYTACAGEAIAKAGYAGTVDYVASSLARLIRNSPDHWSYIGSGEYRYIGVGITYESGMWYCDVALTKDNYG